MFYVFNTKHLSILPPDQVKIIVLLYVFFHVNFVKKIIFEIIDEINLELCCGGQIVFIQSKSICIKSLKFKPQILVLKLFVPDPGKYLNSVVLLLIVRLNLKLFIDHILLILCHKKVKLMQRKECYK